MLLQLRNMLDKWTHDLESGGQIDAVYTDFEKAFDKVPHKRLLNNIRSYGFPRELTNWIEAFHIHSHSLYCTRKKVCNTNIQYKQRKYNRNRQKLIELIEGLSLNSVVNYSLET